MKPQSTLLIPQLIQSYVSFFASTARAFWRDTRSSSSCFLHWSL